jgi:flagellar FliL protein
MTITSPAQGATDEGEVVAKKGGKKKVLMIVVLILAIGAAAYWFLLRPSAEAKAPEPGEVVKLEPIQVNLSGGHYLKIGIALQLTAEAHEADGSKALDATIELFSGRSMEQLGNHATRAKLKKALEKELEHEYHGEVMDVYFTEFVTQ